MECRKGKVLPTLVTHEYINNEVLELCLLTFLHQSAGRIDTQHTVVLTTFLILPFTYAHAAEASLRSAPHSAA